MIGATELKGGLYALKIPISAIPIIPPVLTSSQILYTHTVQAPNIWHRRLGHIPYRRLNVMDKFYSFLDCSNTIFSNNVQPCDSCHFAKQQCLPYSTRSSKTSYIYMIWCT